MTSGFEVEYEEAWAAGSALLRAGDDVDAAGRAGILLGADAYGGARLVGAGRSFGARFEHLLVQGLAEEAVAAGENLHATVRDYADVDVLALGLLPAAPAGAL